MARQFEDVLQTPIGWILSAILLGCLFVGLFKLIGGVLRAVRERRARSWPTTTATIDIATVEQRQRQKRVTRRQYRQARAQFDTYFLVMLTYSYRNPDSQTGDYTRRFDYEFDADQWAEACKGRTVTVHVHPRDPANSVLRSEELDSAVPKPSWVAQ